MCAGSCGGILQWSSFSTKRVCDEDEVLKLHLTARQQTGTESPSVMCQAGGRQAGKCVVVLVERAHSFSTKDRSPTQFIQFSKTLYNIFHGDPEEESLYRAVAHVTSLLLRMEEVGRRLQEPSSPAESTKPGAADEEEPSTEEAPPTPESSDPSRSRISQDAGADLTEMQWSFSFEQVLASLLNEPTVVRFFERPVDVQTKLGHARVAQLKLKANQ
ncbi:TBC1 domain family member 8B [Liparis tanakae]|uniref:TBC1 domain family member 8B n=1 Tax=Liparis tanakae TaxID=230148 RepID=A0A4Z2F3I6_9TELE|nr:TBC1 domain family member 8B [Liparis tanakae]